MQFLDKSVRMTDDVRAIEDYIDLGQIEEVINMVKDEIKLSETYIAEKGWELCEEARQEATEWYEFKMEDLYYTERDSKIGEPESPPTTPPK